MQEEALDKQVVGDVNVETNKFIREKAHFYGRSSKSLTKYRKRINMAAEELALANPALLHNRQALLEQSRVKVDADGYVYKKGKSRAKRHLESEEENPAPPKRLKTSESVRIA